MKRCTGPCEQGRRACPTPAACEIPENNEPMLAVLKDLCVAVVCVALAALLALVLTGRAQ